MRSGIAESWCAFARFGGRAEGRWENTMETGASTAVVTNPATSTATTWAIDAGHTTVEFSVKHMMVSTTKGRFGGVSGTLSIDEQNPERSSADVTIDASTIDTREE